MSTNNYIYSIIIIHLFCIFIHVSLSPTRWIPSYNTFFLDWSLSVFYIGLSILALICIWNILQYNIEWYDSRAICALNSQQGHCRASASSPCVTVGSLRVLQLLLTTQRHACVRMRTQLVSANCPYWMNMGVNGCLSVNVSVSTLQVTGYCPMCSDFTNKQLLYKQAVFFFQKRNKMNVAVLNGYKYISSTLKRTVTHTAILLYSITK